MKKTSMLMLSLITLPAYGQSVLSVLNQHQDNINSSGNSSSSGSSVIVSTPDVKSSAESISSSSAKCEENDQTSLPLAYVTSLIQEKNGSLDIVHDPRSGSLSISSPDMISNCSSMLDWKLKQPQIHDKKAFAIEVKIKSGDTCSDEGCSYKVAHVEKGEFKEFKQMTFKPTLKGFEECLQKSGVIVDGKMVVDAIYNSPISEKFSGLNNSGKLLFLSHGPSTPLAKAKYGKFEHVDVCDYYESAHPQIKDLLTLEDSEKERLKEEANKLKTCNVDEYHKVADFIEKYEGYASELSEVRDRLILEAAKKSAAAIEVGNYTDEDLKVLSDFERYVVEPKVELAHALYDESLDLEGDAKKEKQAELKAVLAEISALNKKPYFLSSHVMKLINDGKFEEAEVMNGIKLVLEHNQRIGVKQDGVVITPAVAAKRVAESKAAFAGALPVEKEKYAYKTGQESGKSSHYAGLASRMRQDIQVRTQNFTQEIQLEAQRIQQPNGYCYKYWRNTQKCIQDSVERIQELQALMAHYNKVDTERAAEYDAQAKSYAELETQGRRYIAAQNGEEPVESAPEVVAPVNTTVPAARPAETQTPGTYSFNFQGNGQGQVQGQLAPQQFQYSGNSTQGIYSNQQQYSPYQYQPSYQYNPWLGQQSYAQTGQNGFNFNWSGGAGIGRNWNGNGAAQGSPYWQPHVQQGYWQQPYQAYNMYSMYGR